MKRASVTMLACALTLAGCGGGASTGGGAPVAPSSGGSESGTLVIVIGPASRSAASSRRTQFVSPSAESVAITVDGGTPLYADVSSYSTLCTTAAGTRTCTLSVLVPAGNATIALAFYDAENGTGTLLGSGTGTTTVVLGTPFTVTIPIEPVVGSALDPVVTYANDTPFSSGTPGSGTLALTYEDPDADTIPAATTFASPLTVTSSDPHVTVAPATIAGSSQTITLTYDGSPSVAPTVDITVLSGTTVIGTVPIGT